MRTCREIRQARADGKDKIGVASKCVSGGPAGHSYRARLQRMIPGKRALARLRLGDGNAMRFDELAQRFRAPVAVNDTAAGDDHRLLRRAKQPDRDVELRGFRQRRADAPKRRREKRFGVVVGLGLHVLRQRRA